MSTYYVQTTEKIVPKIFAEEIMVQDSSAVMKWNPKGYPRASLDSTNNKTLEITTTLTLTEVQDTITAHDYTAALAQLQTDEVQEAGLIQYIPLAVDTSKLLPNTFRVEVDEINHKFRVVILYSDGTTLKKGEVDLVDLS